MCPEFFYKIGSLAFSNLCAIYLLRFCLNSILYWHHENTPRGQSCETILPNVTDEPVNYGKIFSEAEWICISVWKLHQLPGAVFV